VTAPEIHGVSGLDGADLPIPEVRPSNLHAVDFIINTLLESDEKLYLIPTGPLTNIGVALLREPRIKEKIERIVLMGGAAFDSNITPAAEFNIYVDPEAAKIVFESELPLTMVGLDVTNKAIFSFKDIDRLEKFNGKVSKVVASLLRFFARANYEIFGFKGAPLHDALAVSYLIDETVLSTKFLHVDIETRGDFTRGQTVVDVYGVTKKVLNAEVALGLDVDKFKDFIFRAIKILDKG
jgi:inosine-uridine nucleoside N-ribohydrolase